LYAAREFLRGDVVIAYGDIIFDDFILRSLLAADHPIAVAVDSAWQLRGRADDKRDLVVTSGTEDPLRRRLCQLEAVGPSVASARATGEWIGLLRLRAPETEALVLLLEKIAHQMPERLNTWDLPALLQHMVELGKQISVVHSYGHWYDLDDQKGLLVASSQVAR
jgi:phosphoenolpyruvate phosphomutase